jgi:hypothetical protein
MADLTSNIEEAAQQPRSVSVDGQNVQATPIADQVAADKYLKEQTAKGKNHLGMLFRKLIPSDP